MEMVGHKTESIYRRYTITDEAMLRDASAPLAHTETDAPHTSDPVAPERVMLIHRDYR